jgi:hypothetical protein
VRLDDDAKPCFVDLMRWAGTSVFARPWIKLKNPAYSQTAGRHESFNRRRK